MDEQVRTHARNAIEVPFADLRLDSIVDVDGKNTQAATSQPMHLADAVFSAAHWDERIVQRCAARADALDDVVEFTGACRPVDPLFSLILTLMRSTCGADA